MSFFLACTTWSNITWCLITDISQDEALVQSFQDFNEITPILMWTADQLSGEKNHILSYREITFQLIKLWDKNKSF